MEIPDIEVKQYQELTALSDKQPKLVKVVKKTIDFSTFLIQLEDRTFWIYSLEYNKPLSPSTICYRARYSAKTDFVSVYW